MKFGQLIECNIRNIFLQKLFTKCDGETSLRPFSKKIKIEHISGSIVNSFIQFAVVVWQVDGQQNILKLSCRRLAFTSYQAFLKKKRSGTSLPALFSA